MAKMPKPSQPKKGKSRAKNKLDPEFEEHPDGINHRLRQSCLDEYREFVSVNKDSKESGNLKDLRILNWL